MHVCACVRVSAGMTEEVKSSLASSALNAVGPLSRQSSEPRVSQLGREDLLQLFSTCLYHTSVFEALTLMWTQ